MIKSYTKHEFNDLLSSALISLVDEAKKEGASNAATGIMLTGVIVIQRIKKTIFDDNTEMITIEEE